MRNHIIILLFLLLSAIGWSQSSVSIADYDLPNAPSDSARFWLLFQAHSDALAAGKQVSYNGFDTIDIEIPSNAKSIPLGAGINDFSHVVFRVKNSHKNLFLFSRTERPIYYANTDNSAQCESINSGNFQNLTDLDCRNLLIHIVDSSPWVGERQGHAYGHYREDLVRVLDGISAISESPTSAPYDPATSAPHFWIITNPEEHFTFANITILRDSSATCRTYLLDLSYQLNPLLHNIAINTPHSTLVDDCIFRIQHCYQPTLDSILIQGSYSRTNRSGYGILMNNCTLTRISHLFARTPWGVFGTNNMNRVSFINCDFDRFDIHCYGRDISFLHCLQQDSYNQYSSVFGTIRHHRCQFVNFTPVLIESSYNAYNYFQLQMDSCSWHLTPERNFLMDAGKRVRPEAIRLELQPYSLPDINITHLTLTADRKVRQLHLFHFWGKPHSSPIQGIQQLLIDPVFCPKRISIELTDKRHKDIQFQNNLIIKINKHASK